MLCMHSPPLSRSNSVVTHSLTADLLRLDKTEDQISIPGHSRSSRVLMNRRLTWSRFLSPDILRLVEPKMTLSYFLARPAQPAYSTSTALLIHHPWSTNKKTKKPSPFPNQIQWTHLRYLPFIIPWTKSAILLIPCAQSVSMTTVFVASLDIHIWVLSHRRRTPQTPLNHPHPGANVRAYIENLSPQHISVAEGPVKIYSVFMVCCQNRKAVIVSSLLQMTTDRHMFCLWGITN